jgi:hypothetical protein
MSITKLKQQMNNVQINVMGERKKKRYHFSTLQHVQPVNSLINNKS